MKKINDKKWFVHLEKKGDEFLFRFKGVTERIVYSIMLLILAVIIFKEGYFLLNN